MTTPNKTIEIDLRTQKERARDARNAAICSDFRDLSQAAPDAAPSRIFAALAEKYDISLVWVRNIVEAAGLYSPTTDNN